MQSLRFRIEAHLSIMLIMMEKLEKPIVFKQTNWTRYQKTKRETKSARNVRKNRVELGIWAPETLNRNLAWLLL